MREYETVVITKSDVAETYVAGLVKKIDKVVTGKPGEVRKKADWGLKKLAYDIGREKKGRYLFWAYAQKPEAVREVERHLKFDENIIRFMTVTTGEVLDEKQKQQSARKPRKATKKKEGE